MILPLYEGLMTLGEPAIEVLLSRRLRRGKEDPERLDERRGRPCRPRPGGELIWLHAASVGESVAALMLVERLLDPSSDRHVLLTTGSVTSAGLIRQRLPDRALHQFVPIDRPAWARRFLDHWRPNLALVMECDIWPAQLAQARARGIPVVLINGRMSEKSFARWRLMGPLVRPLFSLFNLVLATNPVQAERFSTLGAPYIQIAGNLKRAARPLPTNRTAAETLSTATAGRTIWLAASTHEGEEEPVLDAHQALRRSHPNLLTVIAPRHPQRGAAVAAVANDRGLVSALRSSGRQITPDTDIYIADTLGEMALFFRIARIVFIAGSLVPIGGHNPLEAAHFDCAILFGPLMANNRETAGEMVECGAALTLAGAPALAPTVEALLDDSGRCLRMARNARRYVEDGATVLEQVIATLDPFLPPLPGKIRA